MNKRKLTRKEKLQAARQSAGANIDDLVSKNIKPANRFLPAVIIAVLGFILYANTRQNSFAFDDASVITNNKIVKQGVAGIPEILRTPYRFGFRTGDDEIYRPLPLMVFAVLWDMFPNKPFAFHFVNIILYALTGFVLFKTLRLLMQNVNPVIPFIASLIFVAHPLHTEVVANVKSFDEISSFLFALLTLFFVFRFTDSGGKKNIVMAAVCFFISFLAKEGAITMLAVIPLSLIMFRKGSAGKIVSVMLVLIAVTGIYFAMRVNALGSLAGGKNFIFIDNILAKATDGGTKLATCFAFLLSYIGLLIFPHPLSCDYSFPMIQLASWNEIFPWLSLLFHMAIFIVALWTFKKNKLLSFAILFYLITLSLYSNILITIGAAFAERFMYVPLLGFALAGAWLLCRLFKIPVEYSDSVQSLFQKANAKVLWLLPLILIPYSVKTMARNKDWKDDFVLFSNDAQKNPENARLHFFLGDRVLRDKALKTSDVNEKIFLLDSSIAEFNRALTLYPQYADAFGSRGLAHFRRGEAEKAFDDYSRAIELSAISPYIFNNLGVIYFNRAQYDKCLPLFLKTIELDSAFDEAWRNIGSTYVNTSLDAKAIGPYQKALSLNPQNVDVLFFLGQAYQRLKDEENSKKYFEEAYRLDPSRRPK